MFPKVSQSSQTESLGFPSYSLPLNTPPLRILEKTFHGMFFCTSLARQDKCLNGISLANWIISWVSGQRSGKREGGSWSFHLFAIYVLYIIYLYIIYHILETIQHSMRNTGNSNMVKMQCTPPKFIMEPENDGVQEELPFLGTSFQIPC